MNRHIFGALVGALLATASPALSEPAKIMVPAGAGGGYDSLARTAIAAMEKEGILTEGAQFTNKGGAAGMLGLADFVRTQGQDNSIMFMGVIMVSGTITNKSPITVDQTTPIARLTTEYSAIGVPADSPYKTAGDLVAALKADPGKVPVGGGSAGSVDHVALAMIARDQGIPVDKLNYVGFTGTEAMAAVVGGKISAVISGISELRQQAEAGRIRIIAVTADERVAGLDVPTLKEQGINVTISNWRGVVGAPGMSDEGRKNWIDRFDRLSASAAWNEGRTKLGLTDAYLSGDAFAAFLKEEDTRWKQILNELGLVK